MASFCQKTKQHKIILLYCVNVILLYLTDERKLCLNTAFGAKKKSPLAVLPRKTSALCFRRVPRSLKFLAVTRHLISLHRSPNEGEGGVTSLSVYLTYLYPCVGNTHTRVQPAAERGQKPHSYKVSDKSEAS